MRITYTTLLCDLQLVVDATKADADESGRTGEKEEEKYIHDMDTVTHFNLRGAVVDFNLPEVHYHRRREVGRNMATPMHRIIARRQA